VPAVVPVVVPPVGSPRGLLPALVAHQTAGQSSDPLENEGASCVPCDNPVRLTRETASRSLLESLTLRCPNDRCGAAFHMDEDFSDCFSLSCSRCPTNFCAWCLRSAPEGEDPHSHVLDCTSAPEDMRGSALYLQEHNGGPHEAPRPKHKFDEHWRGINRDRGLGTIKQMAAQMAEGKEEHEAAREEARLLAVLDLHLKACA